MEKEICDDVEECFALGLRYEEGIEVRRSYSKAIKYYEKACEANHADACYRLGNIYHHKRINLLRNFKKAINYYRQSAELGNMDGQNAFAFMLQKGKGIKQNSQEAFKWYKKSAEQGNTEAQKNLARMYEKGQNAFAFILQKGKGIKQNSQEAFKWYKKSAEQGNTEAQKNLARMYEKGIGTEQNNEEAFLWYKKLAEQGNTEAQKNLARMYEKGIGTEQNNEEAFLWYKKLAEHKDANIENKLGYMYENGIGTQKNYKNAVKYYKLSANQGNSEAQKNLGLMYEKGKGVAKHDNLAIIWYKKSAEQGNKNAKFHLKKIKNNIFLELIKYFLGLGYLTRIQYLIVGVIIPIGIMFLYYSYIISLHHYSTRDFLEILYNPSSFFILGLSLWLILISAIQRARDSGKYAIDTIIYYIIIFSIDFTYPSLLTDLLILVIFLELCFEGTKEIRRSKITYIILIVIAIFLLGILYSGYKYKEEKLSNDVKAFNSGVAYTDYNKSIQINPNYAEAYFNRGLAYGKLEKIDLAISDFNKAIKINPNDAKAYDNRGVAYANLGNFQKAKQDAIKASQLGESRLMNIMRQKGVW